MKGDELTLKQRNWLKVYLETGNATEAAMQSYDCKDRETAATVGWENLRKLDFAMLMEEGGITDKKLKEKLVDGLESTKIKTSLTEPDREVPDYATRHKYLETALKLKQRLIDKPANQVNIGEMKVVAILGGSSVPSNDSNK